MSLNVKDKQSNLAVEIASIEENTPVEQIIYVRAHKIGNRNFTVKLEYTKSEQTKGVTEIKYSLCVVKPFEITTQFYTMLYEPLTKGFINEPFFMMPHITCTSPWPIKIIETSVELVSIFYFIKRGAQRRRKVHIVVIEKWNIKTVGAKGRQNFFSGKAKQNKVGAKARQVFLSFYSFLFFSCLSFLVSLLLQLYFVSLYR